MNAAARYMWPFRRAEAGAFWAALGRLQLGQWSLCLLLRWSGHPLSANCLLACALVDVLRRVSRTLLLSPTCCSRAGLWRQNDSP